MGPAFDSSGKYLVFLSDRQLDPIGGGASQSLLRFR